MDIPFNICPVIIIIIIIIIIIMHVNIIVNLK